MKVKGYTPNEPYFAKLQEKCDKEGLKYYISDDSDKMSDKGYKLLKSGKSKVEVIGKDGGIVGKVYIKKNPVIVAKEEHEARVEAAKEKEKEGDK